MLTPEEASKFGEAAYVALGTRELLEYLALRQQAGQTISAATIERVQTTLQPVAKALFTVLKRTGMCPTVRYRGFLFMLTIVGEVVDLQIIRESDIETVE